MIFGSLFAGVGGLDLGLERAGMRCGWQVENDPYATAVLRKHWPDVRRWDDVRTFPPNDGTDWNVDLICGGFPCQPVSLAGKRKAQADERWLWPEFARIIRTLRPRYALMENVPGLLVHGMGDVLGDLAESGYDAEWTSIPAAAVGAPHLRWRVFILAYANGNGFETHSDYDGVWEPRLFGGGSRRLGKMGYPREWVGSRPTGANPMGMGNGLPSDVDRLRCLGNSVVPQVAEVIGRMIMEADARALDGRTGEEQ